MTAVTSVPASALSRTGVMLLMVYCATQLLVPLRSWLYPQQGAREMCGFNFAWRVMLVEKTGDVVFYKFDPVTRAGERISTSPYITNRQRMMITQDPFLIRQFARILGRELNVEQTGHEIIVDSFATLNGHPSQRLVRTGVNPAGEERCEWITPFAHSG
ncbi:hypothetical protein ACXR0O_28140 [Verrucomicrobiota bacterium sgz303538]